MDWTSEIDEETGCTGAEMHALDCTTDLILWYESSRYRAEKLRRHGLVVPADDARKCAAVEQGSGSTEPRAEVA